MANEIQAAFNAVYADGPSSAPTQPRKSDIRSLGTTINDKVESALSSSGAASTAAQAANNAAQQAAASAQSAATSAHGAVSGRVVTSTVAQLNAIVPAVGTFPGGEVYSDPGGESVNGVYTWSGSVWARVSALGQTVLNAKIDNNSRKLREWDWGRHSFIGNVFNKDTMVPDTALNGETGATFAAAGFATSGFVPVLGGRPFQANINISQHAFYDINYVRIAGSNSSGFPAFTSINAPAGAYFMRFLVGPGADMTGVMISTVDAVPGDYIPFGVPQISAYSLPWAGKVYSAIGDSITDVEFYQPVVATRIAARYSRRDLDGLSGRQMVEMPAVLTDAYVDGFDCNIMTCWLGTNDFSVGGKPLGSVSDAVGADTFIGAQKSVIEKIYTRKPDMTLGFITPLKRYPSTLIPTLASWDTPNAQGATLTDYADAIIAVCDLYSLPVLDLFRVSGINRLTALDPSGGGRRLGDGLHPSLQEHQTNLARHISQFINTVC